MSYFLCLAVPRAVADKLLRAFDPMIRFTDASTFPIGEVTRGSRDSRSAFLVQIGSSSASLVGKGGLRRTHNNDHSALLVAGIRTLMENEACHSITFLLHWMQGFVSKEDIPIKNEQTVNIADLADAVLNIAEDVRYKVTR